MSATKSIKKADKKSVDNFKKSSAYVKKPRGTGRPVIEPSGKEKARKRVNLKKELRDSEY